MCYWKIMIRYEGNTLAVRYRFSRNSKEHVLCLYLCVHLEIFDSAYVHVSMCFT